MNSKGLDAKAALVIASYVATNIVFQWMPGDKFRDGKLLFFILTLMLAASVFVARRYDVFLGLALAIFSFLWVFYKIPISGVLPCCGVAAALIFSSYVAERNDVIFLTLRASTWLQIAFSSLQWAGFQPFGVDNPYFNYLIQGNMGHPIVVGCWFAAMAPIAFFYWSRWEFFLILIFSLRTYSSTTILALVGAYAFYQYRLRGRVVLLPIIAGVLALGFAAYLFPHIEFFSFSGRFLVWRRAWELILDNPLGYGPGSWFGRYQEWGVQYPRVWDYLHSDILQLLFEGGVAVFILSVVSIYRIANRIRVPEGAAIFAILANAFGAFPLHIPQIGFLFCALLAIGINKEENIAEGKSYA